MSNSISIGDIQLTFVSGGRLRIDGGNMFGVVPRVMWEKASPPDEQHRIRLDTNCVLVRAGQSLGLIDTGYGGKSPPKHRERHALDTGQPLVDHLAAVGVAPEEVDWVILTHLHFDHAGGATHRDNSGQLKPALPRARYIVQQAEWEDATGNLPELAGAYYPDDFAPLQQAGLIEIVVGDCEIAPGITTQLTGGHTRGHQLVRFQSGGQSAVLLGDICPTVAHLPKFWTMAYDQFPLDVRRVKPVILSDIVDHNRVALLSHDPDVLAARLKRSPGGEIVAEPICRR
jgi:glyoxylase-like metal-dependent hydrolase (beta-lactamase superfamily II)